MTSTPHRCAWCGTDPLFTWPITTREWGHPTRDDRVLFEKAVPGRLPGRPELDHHPAPARVFPRGLRRFDVQALQGFGEDDASGCCKTRASSAIAARSRPSSTNARQVSHRRRPRQPGGPHLVVRTGQGSPGEFRTECPGVPGFGAAASSATTSGSSWGPPSASFMQSVGLVNDHVPK